MLRTHRTKFRIGWPAPASEQSRQLHIGSVRPQALTKTACLLARCSTHVSDTIRSIAAAAILLRVCLLSPVCFADLGSASVSCSLSGLLLGTSPVIEDAKGRRSLSDSSSATSEQESSALTASGDGDHTAAVDRAVAAVAAAEVPLNLGEYSGLVIRAIGDGNKYTLVLRTPASAQSGIEWHLDFESSVKSFATVRLPFSNFVAVRDGRPVNGGPELDRRQLTGLALAFYPQRNNPSQTTGEFYLSLANVKAYRKRDEPEIIYVSDASAPVGDGNSTADSTHELRASTKSRGETIVKASGLTYFIVRPTELTDGPRSRRLSFTQVRELYQLHAADA